jgi:hypothetical protein
MKKIPLLRCGRRKTFSRKILTKEKNGAEKGKKN